MKSYEQVPIAIEEALEVIDNAAIDVNALFEFLKSCEYPENVVRMAIWEILGREDIEHDGKTIKKRKTHG